jgi:hypothetical protein
LKRLRRVYRHIHISLEKLQDEKNEFRHEVHFPWPRVESYPLCRSIRDTTSKSFWCDARQSFSRSSNSTVGFYRTVNHANASHLVASIAPPDQLKDGQLIHGKRILPEEVIFDDIRDWTSQCLEHHDCSKTVMSLQLTKFSLIDRVESRIIPTSQPLAEMKAPQGETANEFKYIAQSYVWGKIEHDDPAASDSSFNP